MERHDGQLAYGARFALGQSCWVSGDYREGIEILTPNLPENLANPDHIRDFAIAGSLTLDSLAMISGCHTQLGEFDRAFALFQQMHDLIGQIQATAFDHMVMGSHPPRALLLRGEYGPAIPLLEKNRKLVAEAGMRFSLPWQTGFLGQAKVMAGQIEEGVVLLEESLKDCAAIYFSAVIRVLFADGLLAMGKTAESLAAASENLRLCRDLGYQAHQAETLRVMASALASTDLRKAEECARQALKLSSSLGMRPEQAHGLRVLGEIQDRAGNPHAARDAEARAEGLYRDLKMTRWLKKSADASAVQP
jgi:tetratricopeptide (TPR) repeat protein